ncbi:MAG: tetratricopeptide repeat protein [bacterium]
MTESRLVRLETLFSECVALPAGERAAFLDARCAGDAAMRAELEALLALDARPEPPVLPRVVERAAASGAATASRASSATLDAPPPEQIGPYRIAERLGVGGFGEVFAAEQTTPVKRRVALKILKAGMDSKAILARFGAEREALALMDHPGVAKVLDAGATETGRPYFVMELVPGESITDYCDRRAPSTRERLDLFVAVCRAVEHAHQKGIIHRDIKASNVLVATADGKALPKVIDFGIAKAAAAASGGETMHTRAGEFLGTPEYMSPEQAASSGIDVDTRTDVYSLGVLLYRILAGRLPFESERLRGAGLSEAQRILREEEPLRPSEHVRALRGDLDWIVMRAMEKDRARRYPSAAALADDVVRHLRDEPVLAGPPSTAYRFGKLARRHRALIVGATAVVVTLLVGIAATTTQAVRARRAEREARHAEEEARRQAEVATAVNAFLTEMVSEANPEENPRGGDVTVREMVDRAARLLEGGAAESPRVAAALRHALGTTYMGLGRFDEAEAHVRAAAEMRRASAGAHSVETLESELALADLDMRRRRYAEAESGYAAIAGAIDALPPPAGSLRGRLLHLRGANLTNLGRYEEADSLLAAAIAIARGAGGVEGSSGLVGGSGGNDATASAANPAELAGSLAERARLHEKLGRYDSAETLAREALANARHAYSGDHANVANVAATLASVLATKGSLAEAESLHRESLAIERRILGPAHASTALSLGNLGNVLISAGRLDEAEDCLREAIALLQASLGDENSEVAKMKDNLAVALQNRGEYEEALALRLAALATMRRLYGAVNHDSANPLNNLGALYRLMGRHKEAQAAFEEALSVFRQLHGSEHPLVAIATNNLGKALLDQARAAEAETTFAAALALGERAFPARHPNTGVFRANHGRALAALGRRDEAERELLAAHEVVAAGLGAEHPRTREIAADLAALYEKAGRRDDAARWRAASAAPPRAS